MKNVRNRSKVIIPTFMLFMLFLTRAMQAQDFCDGDPDPDCWCEEYGDCDGDGCAETRGGCDSGGGGGSPCGNAYLVTSDDQSVDGAGNFDAWLTVSNGDGIAGEMTVTAVVSIELPDGTVLPTVTETSSDVASVTASQSGAITSNTDTGNGSLSYSGGMSASCGYGTVGLPIYDIGVSNRTFVFNFVSQGSCFYNLYCPPGVKPTCPTSTFITPAPCAADYILDTSLYIIYAGGSPKCFGVGLGTTSSSPGTCN